MQEASSGVRKNSRASRRLEQENLSVEIDEPSERLDDKSRVLSKLAEKQLREGPKVSEQGLESELSAIERGEHSNNLGTVDEGLGKSTRVNKKAGSNKRAKQRRERALMVQDMLKEKVSLAKQRHKTVRQYREDDESKE